MNEQMNKQMNNKVSWILHAKFCSTVQRSCVIVEVHFNLIEIPPIRLQKQQNLSLGPTGILLPYQLLQVNAAFSFSQLIK